VSQNDSIRGVITQPHYSLERHADRVGGSGAAAVQGMRREPRAWRWARGNAAKSGGRGNDQVTMVKPGSSCGGQGGAFQKPEK
jgi:hypothetical protein